MILNAGLRYDGYAEFDRVTPRTALIFMPSAHQSFKYLYGSAFRAPNMYEQHRVLLRSGRRLSAARNQSTRTKWSGSGTPADWLRTSVSGYWYKAESLITLTATDDPDAFLGVTYVNEGEVRAKGLELEAQMRLWRGAEGHMSYALQEAIDQATGATLANSPRQMGKARVSAPLFGTGSSLAVEVLGIGSRQTMSGNWARCGDYRERDTDQAARTIARTLRHGPQSLRRRLRRTGVRTTTCRTPFLRMGGRSGSAFA